MAFSTGSGTLAHAVKMQAMTSDTF